MAGRMSRTDRRTQLIELGVTLLATRSLDQLALEDVAAAAGISRALPFHYFPTRRDFLVAVLESAAEELLAAGDPAPELPAPERLRAGLEGYVDYIETNPAAYIAIVRGAAGADQELVAVCDRTRSAIVERILDGLNPSERNGRVALAVRGWVGMVEEAAVTWLRDRSIASRGHLIAWLAEAFVLTVAAAGAPSLKEDR